jgi:hypothetical protein
MGGGGIVTSGKGVLTDGKGMQTLSLDEKWIVAFQTDGPTDEAQAREFSEKLHALLQQYNATKILFWGKFRKGPGE